MITLPSVNHKPLDLKNEIKVLESALKSYLKLACFTTKEANAVLKDIQVDPFIWDEREASKFVKVNFPGNKLSSHQPRVVATIAQLVACHRKLIKSQMLLKTPVK